MLVFVDEGDEAALATIRRVASGIILLSDPVIDRAASATDVRPTLTTRQAEVLRCLARGMTNKAIGRELGISHFTVRAHVARLFQVFEVTSRSELQARGTRFRPGDARVPKEMPRVEGEPCASGHSRMKSTSVVQERI